ncbi:MAG: FixH family protein, partial [Myxococcota bacterium]|nr:FixH family protein [Myxococcota bacterium]
MAERRVEPWPWILAGLLAAMMAGSLGFLSIATRHPDPLVVRDAFAVSERYNAAHRARKRAAGLGVELDLGVRESARGVLLRVELRGDAARARGVRSVSVRRVRPAQGGLDATFPLRARDGGFEGEVPLPRQGR